jgi:hypothetical protein
MGWPLPQDYNEAVQDPPSCFADAELRGGRPRPGSLGLPLPRSGNFADVYELHCPATGNRWAVKCFTREVPGLRQRYAGISKHLQKSKFPFAVELEFLEQGIRAGGHWYPALKMRWVEGLLLNDFVRLSLDRPVQLGALFQIWVRVARRLREAGVGHGDLQHGNVLLVPGSAVSSLALRLIDYDGMWVPALAGMPPVDAGHPNYQHPRRLREGTYGPEVDRFPLLVVGTALRALVVVGRGLWDRHDNGDNLLFREDDFRDPGRSPLFAQLHANADPLLRTLAEKLHEACSLRADQVPLLENLTEGCPSVPSVAVATAPAAPAPAVVVAEVLPVAEVADVAPPAAASRPGGPWSILPAWAWGATGGGLLAVWLAVAVAWVAVRGRPGPAAHTGPGLAVVPPTSANDVAPDTPDRGIPAKAPPAAQSDPAAPPAASQLCRALGIFSEMLALAGDNSPASWQLWKYRGPGSQPEFGLVGDFGDHKGRITAFGASPDGHYVITASDDGTARLWDTGTKKPLGVLRGDGRPFTAVAVGADGKRAATAQGPTVRVWDVGRQEALGDLAAPGPVTALAFAFDGRFLAAGLAEQAGPDGPGTVMVYNAETFEQLQRFRAGGLGTVTALAFSPDPNFLAAGGTGKLVCRIDRAQGLNRSGPFLLSGEVRHVAFRALNGDVLFVGRHGALVRDQSLEKVLVRFEQPPDTLVAAGFDATSLVVLAVGGNGPIRRQVLDIPRRNAP